MEPKEYEWNQKNKTGTERIRFLFVDSDICKSTIKRQLIF